MPLLLALCGNRRDLQIQEVQLTLVTQEAVAAEFSRQEHAFRSRIESIYDSNWITDPGETAVAPVPPTATVFADILYSSETSIPPFHAEQIADVRGLAMKSADVDSIRIQSFSKAQVLHEKGVMSLFLQRGTYTKLDGPGFRLADKLTCIVEQGLVKFGSLHTLSRIIDTSSIFSEATDPEVEAFVEQHVDLFSLNLGNFMENTSRNARKYITSLAASGSLQGHTAATLRHEAQQTDLSINIKNGRIVMPEHSGEITELLRFLNDGRYVGPVSGRPFVTNSRRPAP